MVCFIYCYHIKEKKQIFLFAIQKLSDLADLSRKLGCRSATSKVEIMEEIKQTFLEMERRKNNDRKKTGRSQRLQHKMG